MPVFQNFNQTFYLRIKRPTLWIKVVEKAHINICINNMSIFHKKQGFVHGSNIKEFLQTFDMDPA